MLKVWVFFLLGEATWGCSPPSGYDDNVLNKYYKKYPASDFTSAVATCQGEGAELAMPTTSDEMTKIHDLESEYRKVEVHTGQEFY